MKHYRLTLPQCKDLNAYDQRMMIEALYIDYKEFKKQRDVLTFDTEEDYQKWVRTKSQSN